MMERENKKKDEMINWKLAEAMSGVSAKEVIDMLITMDDFVDAVYVTTRTIERAKELIENIYAEVKTKKLTEDFDICSSQEKENRIEVRRKNASVNMALMLSDNIEANIRKNEKEAMAELARELRR
jgi:GrpB-like predicted nucleotidyltransferase (UPF0157 family)